MAEVYTRVGSGYYQCRFPLDGRVVRLSTGVKVGKGKDARGLAEAQARADELEAAERERTEAAAAPGGLRFYQASEAFLATAGLRPSTARRYRVSRENFRRIMGDPVLNRITTADIEGFVLRRRQERDRVTGRTISAPTIIRDMTFLSSLCSWVAGFEPGFENPVPKVSRKRLNLKESPARETWLTQDDFEFLLSLVRSRQHRAILVLAVETGMRKGEILGLREKEYDWPGRRVVLANMDPSRTKTGGSRVVYLTPRALDALESTLQARDEAVRRHRPEPHDLVFVSPRTGLPFDGIDRWWWSLKQKAGRQRPAFKRLRFHDLRHTFASWSAQVGIDAQATQAQLGHKTDSMTRRYRHLGGEALKRAAELFAARGSGTVPSTQSSTTDGGLSDKERQEE